MTVVPSDYRISTPVSSSLDVFLLGTLELSAALDLQERLRREIAGRSDAHGAILICEHPPSVTIGREGSFADVLVEREELTARNMEIRWLNRGGGTFVHLPGQLAAYVIVPVERLKLGLAGFRAALETSLIANARDLKVNAERGTTLAGATCRCGQFGFIGAAVRDWVSHGGVYVNVSPPQEGLDLVNWSNADVRITSLSAQRTRPTSMSTVRESLARNLAVALRYPDFHLYTGHPLLHRSTRKVYVYVS